MLYINWILENKELFLQAMKNRGRNIDLDSILQVDKERREIILKTEELQRQKNEIASRIGMAKSKGENIDELMKSAEVIKENLSGLEEKMSQKIAELNNILLSLPNIPSPDVPPGRDENDNKEIREIGDVPIFNFQPLEHFDIAERSGEMDFETAAKISGSRFVILKNNLAKLERALINFMIENNTSRGFTEVSPPILTKEKAFYGTGQLPKFEGNFFQVEGGYYLIPTAEVSLTNMVSDSIIPEHELPLRFTAATPCFRSEAGAAGKDTRGMIRQHQFMKVELVSVVNPEKSEAEHEYMLETSEAILKALKLPYRVVVLCTGDMGGSAKKTYDIEVWMPGQNCYREISSVSNTGCYQARRMQAKYRRAADKKTDFVHTLNGSSLAVGRTIIAILENYQRVDKTVVVPEVLRDFMKIELMKF